MRQKHLLAFLILVAILVCVSEFFGQPLLQYVHHLSLWKNESSETVQQISRFPSEDLEHLNRKSSDESRSVLGGEEKEEMSIVSGSDVNSSRGLSRDVCVGSNASLGEVEDLLCMVSWLFYLSLKGREISSVTRV